MSQTYTYNNSKPHGPDNQYLLNEPDLRTGSGSRNANKDSDYYEKQPLFERIPVEPVRLTPAWEETNLPNDELNFREVTMERADLEMNPPKDRLNLVYWILLIHGIGTLTPWNIFITANDYFVEYKLDKNYTGVMDSNYVTHFLNYLGFAAQIPNLLFNWLNIFVQIGGDLTTRIVWSILIEVVVIIVTIVLAMCDSSRWPGTFFWITMICVVILNMANGIYQNTVFGMAAKLPFRYSGVVILGANLSGTVTSIISVMSTVMAPNIRTAAIYYFITALFVLLACFDTYFALPLNRFYRYHELLSEKQKKSLKKQNDRGTSETVPYWKIFKDAFPQCLNVFLVFFVTLSVFPNIMAGVQRSDNDFFVGEALYTHVMCFLTFNIGAFLGSCLSAWVTWPSPKYLIVPVLLRLLYIPFFVICNFVPENTPRLFPIFIQNDWIFWIGGITMAVSSGYFSSLAMMYCPRSVESQHASTAGMYGAACLITGIFVGILFGMLLTIFVTSVEWVL